MCFEYLFSFFFLLSYYDGVLGGHLVSTRSNLSVRSVPVRRLGSLDDATDFPALEAHNITAILNAAWSGCLYQRACRSWSSPQPTKSTKTATSVPQVQMHSQLSGLGEWHLAVDAEDHPDYPISMHFDQAVDFLRRCRSARRHVLVHCVAGLNRAPCLCAAFLMREGLIDGKALSAAQAVAWISQRRAGVFENRGFLKQLEAEETPRTDVSDCQPAKAQKPGQGHAGREVPLSILGTVKERHAAMALQAQEGGEHLEEEVLSAQRPSRFKAACRNLAGDEPKPNPHGGQKSHAGLLVSSCASLQLAAHSL